MDLRAIPPELLLAFALAALLLAGVQTLRLVLRAASRRARLRAIRERGAAGEVRAEALLIDRGYTILGRQVAVSYDVHVNDEPVAIDLRVDYLVAREGRRYVAEVKTGRLAPRIETPATRRQLLEYRLAFGVDDVLLVDAEAARVHTVVFPEPAARVIDAGQGARFVWLLAGILAGLLGALALRTPG